MRRFELDLTHLSKQDLACRRSAMKRRRRRLDAEIRQTLKTLDAKLAERHRLELEERAIDAAAT
jgi:hypothetical protein